MAREQSANPPHHTYVAQGREGLADHWWNVYAGTGDSTEVKGLSWRSPEKRPLVLLLAVQDSPLGASLRAAGCRFLWESLHHNQAHRKQ